MNFSFLTKNTGSVNPNYVPPASVLISKRDEKTQILYEELKYWGLINKETDMGAVKAIANELSYRMLMRVVCKLQRKRMSGN
jgi:hypothetical protein